ncbi:hypothetical protein MAH1_33720 [Sessilibacter sp. MAH1]
MLVINPNDISATVRSCYALCSESVKGRSDFLSPGGRKPLNAEEARAVAAGIVGFVENRCGALTRAYYRFMFARNLNLLAEQAVLVGCARGYVVNEAALKPKYENDLFCILTFVPLFLRARIEGNTALSKRELASFAGCDRRSFDRNVFPAFINLCERIELEVSEDDKKISLKISRSLSELNFTKKYA